MNDKQTRILEIKRQLDDIAQEITDLEAEEQGEFDSLSEPDKKLEHGFMLDSRISMLNSACGSVGEAIGYLHTAIGLIID